MRKTHAYNAIKAAVESSNDIVTERSGNYRVDMVNREWDLLLKFFYEDKAGRIYHIGDFDYVGRRGKFIQHNINKTHEKVVANFKQALTDLDYNISETITGV